MTSKPVGHCSLDAALTARLLYRTCEKLRGPLQNDI